MSTTEVRLSLNEAEWFGFLMGLDPVERAVVYEHELEWHDAWISCAMTVDDIRKRINEELMTA